MKKLILVNGIPASGKSSVARMIADHFNAPLLSIDEIKEPFMLQFSDIIDRQLNRKLGNAAYQAMFNIVRNAPENAVFILDAWFGFRDKTVLLQHLTMCGCQQVIEVWNRISPELAAARYQQRCADRIKGHPGEKYIPELMLLADSAKPLRLGELYTIDQDKRGDRNELISWVNQRLNHI